MAAASSSGDGNATLTDDNEDQLMGVTPATGSDVDPVAYTYDLASNRTSEQDTNYADPQADSLTRRVGGSSPSECIQEGQGLWNVAEADCMSGGREARKTP